MDDRCSQSVSPHGFMRVLKSLTPPNSKIISENDKGMGVYIDSFTINVPIKDMLLSYMKLVRGKKFDVRKVPS